MFSEIDNLVIELKTDKVAIRRKAFNSLYEILNSRLPSLQKFLNEDEDYSWGKLFKVAHQGITIHSQKLHSANKELNENDTSITNYSRAILKLCDSPANGKFV